MERLLLLTKAVADRTRLRIMNALLNRNELCACQIIELLELSGATISRHMGILIQAGLVESRREGKWVYYSLARTPGNETVLKMVGEGLRGTPQVDTDLVALNGIVSKSACGEGEGK